MSHFYELVAPALSVGVSAALLLALIFLILGPIKRYWIIAVYVAWELLANAALTVADVMLHGSGVQHSAARSLYARLYWPTDVIDVLFRFVLVIVLIYWSSDGPKRVSARLLGGLVLLMTVLPFVIFNLHLNPSPAGGTQSLFPSASWFVSTSELLNFGAAIMNLLLWASLIASKRRDPQLLAVSAGLGIVVTGTALAYAIFHFTGESQFGAVAEFFLNLTQLIGWTIWCFAFWPARKRKQQLSGVVSTP